MQTLANLIFFRLVFGHELFFTVKNGNPFLIPHTFCLLFSFFINLNITLFYLQYKGGRLHFIVRNCLCIQLIKAKRFVLLAFGVWVESEMKMFVNKLSEQVFSGNQHISDIAECIHHAQLYCGKVSFNPKDILRCKNSSYYFTF